MSGSNRHGATARIDRVEATVVRVPLDTPTSFATRQVRHRDYLLVRLHTDDGMTGIGFCYCGSTAGGIGALAVRDLLAPVVRGHDPLRVEWLWQAMYREALLHGRTGTVMRALSAIDIAIWDRAATRTFAPDDLHDATGYDPYAGRTVGGWPVTVLRRGEIVVEEGVLRASPGSGRRVPMAVSPAMRPLPDPPAARLDP